VLHLPHKDVNAEQFLASIRAAHRKMHRRHRLLATEASVAWPLHENEVLVRLDRANPARACARYSPALAQRLAHRYLARPARTLLVGADARLASRLPAARLLAPNARIARALRAASRAPVDVGIACDTLFQDDAYDVALVTDWLRLMGRAIRPVVLAELFRVARRVLLLHTQQFLPGTALDGWPGASFEDVQVSAYEAGLRVTLVEQLGAVSLCELRSAPRRRHSG
jgi:hypothetical protein